MRTDFEVVPLGEVAAFRSGGTPSKKVASYWEGEIPWVSAKDMKALRLRGSQDQISEAGLSAGSRLAPVGAVLLLTRGMTLLKDVPICVADVPVAFNQDVKAIEAGPRLESAFLLYALLAKKQELLGLVDLAGHGTGRLNTHVLNNLEVSLPPLDEQRRIAHILGALDDKIEVNRRMSETLEEMARALFKSWFVDFDPVRAKAEGRDTGLPPHIADLFPDRLIDSELGHVPDGWNLATLGESLRETRERVEQRDVPAYSCTNAGLLPRDARFKKQLNADPSRNKLVLRDQFVFGISREILNFGRLDVEAAGVSSAYRVFSVQGGSVEPKFLERFIRLRHDYYYRAVAASSREGQSTSLASLSSLATLVPPAGLQAQMRDVLEPFELRIKVLNHEVATLVETRDALLRELIG